MRAPTRLALLARDVDGVAKRCEGIAGAAAELPSPGLETRVSVEMAAAALRAALKRLPAPAPPELPPTEHRSRTYFAAQELLRCKLCTAMVRPGRFLEHLRSCDFLVATEADVEGCFAPIEEKRATPPNVAPARSG